MGEKNLEDYKSWNEDEIDGFKWQVYFFSS